MNRELYCFVAFGSLLFMAGCGSSDVSQSINDPNPPPAPPPAPIPPPPPGQTGISMSTYIGGGLYDTVRDVAIDAAGNLYITGGTESADFPLTGGAYQTVINPGTGTGDGQALPQDVFVAKLSPGGQLIWSTLIGGPNYDRAYAVEVDAQGYVYVGGRAGDDFPVTPGAFQTAFAGGGAGGLYGSQDGFVCKLEPDGSAVVFCSYFGTSDVGIVRDLDIDAAGDIYVGSAASTSGLPAAWFTNAYQAQRRGGNDAVVAKIRTDGSAVEWATYLGGNGNDGGGPSIRVDASNNVLFLLSTGSTDLPTPGGFDGTLGGNADVFLAKISSDGSSLLFGTYIGGSGEEHTETHELEVDAQGIAYVVGKTTSTDFPTTPGAFQTTYAGSGGGSTGQFSNYPGDGFVMKITQSGGLVASTLIGGRFGDGAEGVAVGPAGEVYFSGATFSPDFPVSEGQTYGSGGSSDAFAALLSPDLSTLVYCIRMGGSSQDAGRNADLDPNGDFYFGGETSSTDWPTLDARQASQAGVSDGLLVKVITPG